MKKTLFTLAFVAIALMTASQIESYSQTQATSTERTSPKIVSPSTSLPMKRSPQSAKPDRAARAKRKPRYAVIGGVRVELQGASGKGNLPMSLIRRIVDEAIAGRKANRA